VEYLILRTVDGDDTLSITEHPCVDARALLATLATGRVVRTNGAGRPLRLTSAWCKPDAPSFTGIGDNR
jgi:hypothetical protein